MLLIILVSISLLVSILNSKNDQIYQLQNQIEQFISNEVMFEGIYDIDI